MIDQLAPFMAAFVTSGIMLGMLIDNARTAGYTNDIPTQFPCALLLRAIGAGTVRRMPEVTLGLEWCLVANKPCF